MGGGLLKFSDFDLIRYNTKHLDRQVGQTVDPGHMQQNLWSVLFAILDTFR